VTRRPTTKMVRMDPRPPAPRELVRLVIDYASVDDFLVDFEESLSGGSTCIETSRQMEVRTVVELELAFPGLREPIVIPAIVKARDEARNEITVGFLDNASQRLAALVDRIRMRDARTVGHVYNVLIVEDNHHISELVRSGLAATAKRELKDVAFAFETATDGASALQLFKARSFDAAIIDVYLPVLDGATLIQQVRQTLQLTVPIIAMSGGGDSARIAAQRAGATVFLDKPVRLRQVVETIRQLIGLPSVRVNVHERQGERA
jgi:CheY-like chemotaxis protein